MSRASKTDPPAASPTGDRPLESAASPVQAALWPPVATRAVARARARLLADTRAFFASREVLEVETPVLSCCATTDPNIESLPCGERFLQTSPEFAMKRLLAAGYGAIYQICKVFRAGEAGRWHNPEFTMLEWYRPGFDHHQLMDETAALLAALLDLKEGYTPRRLSYAEAFQQVLGLDPHRAEPAALATRAAELNLAPAGGSAALDRDGWLDLLLSQAVVPRLEPRQLYFIYDFPASQASLACIRQGTVAVAERFEAFWQGMELANGFNELRDAEELAARLRADAAARAGRGQRAVPHDSRLLAALQAGLPACAGVAVGLDRVLMARLAVSDIEQVLNFPWARA